MGGTPPGMNYLVRALLAFLNLHSFVRPLHSGRFDLRAGRAARSLCLFRAGWPPVRRRSVWPSKILQVDDGKSRSLRRMSQLSCMTSLPRGTPTSRRCERVSGSASHVRGSETCRHCPYRLVCTQYWETLELRWAHGSVAGRVLRSRRSEGGSVTEVRAESPVDAAGVGWVVSAAPEDPGNASSVAIVDAESTGTDRLLRWRWSTMMRVL
jgi:hypothetical protein